MSIVHSGGHCLNPREGINSWTRAAKTRCLDLASMPAAAAHTLEAAKTLLNDLRPRIAALLAGRRASVRLESMDIMPPERRDAERAHVMWVGPSQTEGGDLFRDVAGMSWRCFQNAVRGPHSRIRS